MTGDIEARGGSILKMTTQAGGEELIAHLVSVAQGLLEDLAEAPLEQAAVIPAEARDALGGRGVPREVGFEQWVAVVEGHHFIGFADARGVSEAEQREQEARLEGGIGLQELHEFRVGPIQGINLAKQRLQQPLARAPGGQIPRNAEAFGCVLLFY